MEQMKIVFERIYKNFCMGDIEAMCSSGDKESMEFGDFMKKFVEFRLDVSGGEDSGCAVSMKNVNNLVDEIVLFCDLMCDGNGAYRGDYCYEELDSLREVISKEDISDEIKNEIINEYKKRYGMDE